MTVKFLKIGLLAISVAAFGGANADQYARPPALEELKDPPKIRPPTQQQIDAIEKSRQEAENKAAKERERKNSDSRSQGKND